MNEGRSLPIVDSRRPECVERPFAKGLANGAEQSLLVVQKSKQSAQKLRRESSVALISGPVGEQSGKTRENSLPSRLYESIASSFRTICKIFAPRIDVNQDDRLRGVEIRCVEGPLPPLGTFWLERNAASFDGYLHATRRRKLEVSSGRRRVVQSRTFCISRRLSSAP